MLIGPFPKQFIRFQMDFCGGMWVGNPFLDYFYYGAMI